MVLPETKREALPHLNVMGTDATASAPEDLIVKPHFGRAGEIENPEFWIYLKDRDARRMPGHCRNPQVIHTLYFAGIRRTSHYFAISIT